MIVILYGSCVSYQHLYKTCYITLILHAFELTTMSARGAGDDGSLTARRKRENIVRNHWNYLRRHFQATLVATKPHIFDYTSGRFTAVSVAKTRLDIFARCWDIFRLCLLQQIHIFDETSTHLPAVSLPEKNGHFWWDDGKTPDFFGTRCHNFRAVIVTTPHPRQSKSIAVASCTMKKCKVSIHLLVVATYIPQSRATEDMHSWYIGEYRIGNWIRICF